VDSTRIYRLDCLPGKVQWRIKEAQMEAARVWMRCRDLHLRARREHLPWPRRDDLQQATKGQYALHSQTVQMICHKFLTNIDNTQQVRKRNKQIRYPYKDKHFYPLYWPAQAVSVESGRVVLPMGRGRPALVLHRDLPANTGACTIVWNDGYELHVTIARRRAEEPPGPERAAIDLGEIHQAAVPTSSGVALVVSGRGIRSIKRRCNQALGTIARKRARCKKGSKRWRKLQHARRKVSARTERQVRDLRH
jgi:putative transposase